jgi:hypothetical protein
MGTMARDSSITGDSGDGYRAMGPQIGRGAPWVCQDTLTPGSLVSSALFGWWHVLPSLGLAATVLFTGLAGVVFCELQGCSGRLLAPADSPPHQACRPVRMSSPSLGRIGSPMRETFTGLEAAVRGGRQQNCRGRQGGQRMLNRGLQRLRNHRRDEPLTKIRMISQHP